MSLARVITVVTAALVTVVASASAASASSTPDTWPEGEGLTTLQTLAYFVGGPLLLFAIIWVVSATVAAKSHNHVPTIPSTDLEKAPSHEVAGH